jgi:hypothetical protein
LCLSPTLRLVNNCDPPSIALAPHAPSSSLICQHQHYHVTSRADDGSDARRERRDCQRVVAQNSIVACIAGLFCLRSIAPEDVTSMLR